MFYVLHSHRGFKSEKANVSPCLNVVVTILFGLLGANISAKDITRIEKSKLSNPADNAPEATTTTPGVVSIVFEFSYTHFTYFSNNQLYTFLVFSEFPPNTRTTFFSSIAFCIS